MSSAMMLESELMQDRLTARREFLREGSASRIRRLAADVTTICDRLSNGVDVADVREKIDECSWMIEWAVPDEAPEVQAELVELQTALSRWRGRLQTFHSDAPARALARDRACAWAERLRWLSAMLEATS